MPLNDEKTTNTRTNLQNRSLHLFCELLAKELNLSGLDMKTVLKPEVDIPWTKQTVKDYLWRPIQQAMTQKKSTTEITTTEPSDIWEVLNRHLGEKFGIEVPNFPSQEETKNYQQSLEQ